MLVNNLSEYFNKVILEVRGKLILTMMETIRTKIMLLIINKKEAEKKKGIMCLKIKKKLDVNMKDSLRNWDLTSIPCMYAVATIHLKDEYPKTYVKIWYTKQTQLAIYSNFIRPPSTLRRPLGKPTKAKRHKVGVHNEMVASTRQKATPTQQEAAPTHQQVGAPRERLLFKRKPTTVR
ncbi:hypothetical protein GOBAR_DD07781 [Gossypium barbadense]|nr:hypothetical protein GOBAR_DD07781 [Gossypium barbadense]